MTLPLANGASASAPLPIAVEPANILIVDDRTSNLRAMEAMLRRPDYNLVLARSGAEALGQVLRRPFDVILLDVAMPDMDGFETATLIKEREQSRFIPIIFVTASVFDMKHIFRGYTVGAVDYLRKPLDPHAVRAKVAVFVELFRERRRTERQALQLQAAERLLRERTEEALHQSEALYEATFAEAPVGIGHASPEALWTKTNRALGELLGRASSALTDTRVEAIVDETQMERLSMELERVRAGEATLYVSEYPLRKAGGLAWGQLNVSALRDANRRLRYFIVVVEDITERKQVELERNRLVHELLDAVRARDDFLAVAAHELKTPLTPLRLQTNSLLRELGRGGPRGMTTEDLTRRLSAIDVASARLEGVIETLLDASRIRIGRMRIELDDVELAPLLREEIERVHPDAVRAGSSIELRADESIRGRWDRVRVGQIFGNLLSNAIRFGEGKPIVVSATRDGETVSIRVRDGGVGIPSEARARIFERFERLGPVRHHGGFGLGLWLAREIALAHGGTIDVRSEVGEGAEFTVTLPIAPPTRAKPSGSDKTEVSS